MHTVSDRRMARALVGEGYLGFWVTILMAIPWKNMSSKYGSTQELDAETVSRAAREPGKWDWEGHSGSMLCPRAGDQHSVPSQA